MKTENSHGWTLLRKERKDLALRGTLRIIQCRRPFDFRRVTIESCQDPDHALERIKFWQNKFPDFYFYLSRDETILQLIDHD